MTMGIRDSLMITLIHTPLNDTDDEAPYRVAAEIYPASVHSLIPESLLVYWSLNSSGPFTPVQMNQVSRSDSFQAYIPAQSSGETVYYYLTAADDNGGSAIDPMVAPDWTYSFSVVADTVPPEIFHDPLSDMGTGLWPPVCEATVTDDRGVSSVTLEYRINGIDQTPVPMNQVPWTYVYRGSFGGSVEDGDVVSYLIRAVDTASDSNVSYDPETGYHTFQILESIPACIWDPDDTPLSGPFISDVLDSLGIAHHYVTSFPDSLFGYDMVFVCLGVYPSNDPLTSSQANDIVDYIQNGGKVYMEGADCWCYDDHRDVYNPHFGVSEDGDGSSDLYQVAGYSGTFTEGMSFVYNGENNYMDRLDALIDSGAYRIFFNPANSRGYGVAREAGTKRTVALSFELGGLVDDVSPSIRANLIREILDFFGLDIASGDVNGDGRVSVTDAAYLARFLHHGGPGPDPFLSGDLDGDFDVDSDDLAELMHVLFFGGTPPKPAERTTPGDRTLQE
jgi:hypothetical protein